MLTYFSNAGFLRGVDRLSLTRLLENHQDSLPPQAAALLSTTLTHEQFCDEWAAQFRASRTLGLPLLHALSAIETLAVHDNGSLLDDAISNLPPEYEVNRNFSPLHQALRLWLLTQAPLGIPWPLPTEISNQSKIENSPAVQTAPPDISAQSKIEIQNSKITLPEQSSIENAPALETAPVDVSPQWKIEIQNSKITDEAEISAQSKIEIQKSKILAPTQPWPEPITDAPALFDAVYGRFTAYSYLPAGAPTVNSLFLGHCHAFPAFHYTPRLNIRSDKENSGKTTTMKVIASMAPRPFPVHNLRPPVVYRLTHKCQPTPPTILFDEIENYLSLYRELLGLLNAGNSSDACVPRCEGKTVRIYKPFAPVVLAGIGDLFRTLRSRSILIHMTEAPEDAKLARFDPDHLELETELRRKLARWAADNLKQIAACDPPLPKTARNRLADNWRPLFQIAHVIGGHWPQLALDAFQALNPSPSSASPSLELSAHARIEIQNSKIAEAPHALLADIRHVFTQTATERLFTRDLIARLNLLPNQPYTALTNGKRSAEQWLAAQLRPLNICPRTLWMNGTVGKGYLRAHFLSDPQPPHG